MNLHAVMSISFLVGRVGRPIPKRLQPPVVDGDEMASTPVVARVLRRIRYAGGDEEEEDADDFFSSVMMTAFVFDDDDDDESTTTEVVDRARKSKNEAARLKGYQQPREKRARMPRIGFLELSSADQEESSYTAVQQLPLPEMVTTTATTAMAELATTIGSGDGNGGISVEEESPEEPLLLTYLSILFLL